MEGCREEERGYGGSLVHARLAAMDWQAVDVRRGPGSICALVPSAGRQGGGLVHQHNHHQEWRGQEEGRDATPPQMGPAVAGR